MVYNYTKPRGPIAAMYSSPGPCYGLPGLVGQKSHDPRSVHNKGAAYPFGVRHGKFRDDCSPGPCYYPKDPAITPTPRCTGTETTAPPTTPFTAAKRMEPCSKCLAPAPTAPRVLDPPLTSATLPTALEPATETGELITLLVSPSSFCLQLFAVNSLAVN